MKKIGIKGIDFKLHHILFAHTSEIEREMKKYILLDEENISDIPQIQEQLRNEDEIYIIIEGDHCSCYDFNDTDWIAIAYTEGELEKLCSSRHYMGKPFYRDIAEHFCFECKEVK
jgi:hypothetical protein